MLWSQNLYQSRMVTEKYNFGRYALKDTGTSEAKKKHELHCEKYPVELDESGDLAIYIVPLCPFCFKRVLQVSHQQIQ